MPLAAAVAGLALAGCGSGSSTGSGMMGAGGPSTATSTGAWDDGRRGGLSLCAHDLLGAAVIAGAHRQRDAGRHGDDEDDGRYRPAGCTHDAACLADHDPRRADQRGGVEPGMAHPRTRDPAAGWPEPPQANAYRAATARLPKPEAWARPPTVAASGTGDGITSGTVSWTTVTLPPGRYELICNLPNHYADGMYQELVVT